jgi:hypothetical protein
MDDTAYQQFFTQPTHTYQRRYEALRAIFVEGRSQKDVAEEFGFTYGTMRQLVFDFRQVCNDDDNPTESFFFETAKANIPSPSSRTTITTPIRRWPIGGN